MDAGDHRPRSAHDPQARPRRRARADRRRARLRRQRRRPPALGTATSSSSRGAIPGDRVRAVVTKRKRDYAEARTIEVLEPGPDRIDAASPTTRARRGRCCPTSASSRSSRAGRRRAAPPRPARRLRARADRPRRRAVALPQQARVLVRHGRRRRARLRLPRRPAAGSRSSTSRTACSPPSAATSCAGCALDALPRAGPRRLRPPRRRRLPAQPRRARGPAHRPGAGAPRHLAGRARRRRARRGARSDVESLIWTQADGVAETTHGGRDELLAGTPRIEEELGGLRFALSSEAFFQTNTEMAERLYGVAAEYAALKGCERVYDLFCGIGTIGLTLAARAGEVWASRSSPRRSRTRAQRARQRDRQRAASSPATCAPC